VSTAGRTGAPSRPQTGEEADGPRTGSEARTTGSTQPVATGAKPVGSTSTGAARPAMTGPRRVKLTVSRADPWSVMKMSFLISVAIGIAGVAMVATLWLVLSGMGVFSDIERTVSSVLSSGATGGGTQFNLMDYIGFGRVVSLAIVIGVIDVILLTALCTLGAFLYNVCSALVGGLQLTLTDD
jgi:Transmembrane domain of unknown function (DUF3566)